METFFAIVVLVFIFVMLFLYLFSHATAASKSSLPSHDNIHLRNMEDASGRFYVDFYRGPNYEGDRWEAIVKAKNREGYIEYVKGGSQRELENNIGEAYMKFVEQWEREKETLLPKGIAPDRYLEELDLGQLDISDSVEITYSVFGYDRLGDTTFDMEVKDKVYEWLQNVEVEDGELTSDYISENRPSLHKRILKAIRNNMKDEACDPDDGLVETNVPPVYRKDFYEDASYDYASDLAEDDDIEYTVTL